MKIKQTLSPEGRRLLASVKGLGSAKSRVGWFPSAKYPDGTPVAGVMAVQEYGSAKQKIPPRPFMRPTAATKHGEWASLAAGAARAVMAGQMTGDGPMQVLGMQAEADVRQAIVEVVSPPLSPRTIKARERRRAAGRKTPPTTPVSTKPLNDTGLAIATLTHEVQK